MKKYLLGIFAVALAIGFSAFTKPAAKVPKPLWGELWFHFTGNNNIPADVNNKDNYQLDNYTGEYPSICETDYDTYRCQILIEPEYPFPNPGPVRPNLSIPHIAEMRRYYP